MSNFTRKIKQFIHQESTHELNGEAQENLTKKLDFFKCLKPVHSWISSATSCTYYQQSCFTMVVDRGKRIKTKDH